MGLQNLLRKCFRDRAYGVVVERARDRYVQVQAGLTRSLQERVQPNAFEQLSVPARDVTRTTEAFAIQLWLRTVGFVAGVDVRIDVGDQVVRIIERRPFDFGQTATELRRQVRRI